MWYSFEPKKCHVNVDTTDMHLCTLRFFLIPLCIADRVNACLIALLIVTSINYHMSHSIPARNMDVALCYLVTDCECSQDGDAQMRAGRHRRHCRATLVLRYASQVIGALPFQEHVTMHVLEVVTLTVLHLSTRHKTYSYWSR